MKCKENGKQIEECQTEYSIQTCEEKLRSTDETGLNADWMVMRRKRGTMVMTMMSKNISVIIFKCT